MADKNKILRMGILMNGMVEGKRKKAALEQRTRMQDMQMKVMEAQAKKYDNDTKVSLAKEKRLSERLGLLTRLLDQNQANEANKETQQSPPKEEQPVMGQSFLNELMESPTEKDPSYAIPGVNATNDQPWNQMSSGDIPTGEVANAGTPGNVSGAPNTYTGSYGSLQVASNRVPRPKNLNDGTAMLMDEMGMGTAYGAMLRDYQDQRRQQKLDERANVNRANEATKYTRKNRYTREGILESYMVNVHGKEKPGSARLAVVQPILRKEEGSDGRIYEWLEDPNSGIPMSELQERYNGRKSLRPKGGQETTGIGGGDLPPGIPKDARIVKHKPMLDSKRSNDLQNMQDALLEIDGFQALLFNEDGSWNNNVLTQLALPKQLPQSEARRAMNMFKNMAEGRLRVESGAAVPPEEVTRMKARLLPTVMDSPDGRRDKMRLMRRYFTGVIEKMDPNKIYSDVVDTYVDTSGAKWVIQENKEAMAMYDRNQKKINEDSDKGSDMIEVNIPSEAKLADGSPLFTITKMGK